MEKYIYVVLILLYIIIHTGLSYNVQQTGEVFYNDRIINNKSTPKIYDIVHKYIPYWKNVKWLDSLIVFITLIPLIYTNKKELYIDFVILSIIVNIIRDITINLTILPKAKECNIKDIDFVYSTMAGGCYDKIFSGHAAIVFLLTLLYYSNSIITNIPILVLWNILSTISILLIRSHYTIDIFVSFLVTYIVFNEYMIRKN